MTATLSHDRLAELCGVPPAPPLLIDVAETARLCQCSTRHFRRLVDSGRAPKPLKLGNLLRFNRAVIEKWVSEGCPNCRNGKGAGQ